MSEHRCTCGNSVDFFTEYNSNQCGLYCGQCGKWQKWINKQEERLYNHKHSLVEHDANVRAAAIAEIERAMYHEAFEVDHVEDDMQKWDGGNWIRYKLFENVLKQMKEQKDDN